MRLHHITSFKFPKISSLTTHIHKHINKLSILPCVQWRQLERTLIPSKEGLRADKGQGKGVIVRYKEATF